MFRRGNELERGPPSLRAGGSGNRGIGELGEERMGLGSHSGVRRVRKALEERAFKARVIELEHTARSAVEAADALGVRVQQIVKSLVFRGRETGRPVLVLAGGANRVDESKISDLFSEPVEMADALYVRRRTGFSIGGVPPVAHAEQPTTFVVTRIFRAKRRSGLQRGTPTRSSG